MNKIEQGIENAESNGGIVYISVEASIISDAIVIESSEKTFSEIKDIILAGKLPVLLVNQNQQIWVGQLCSFKLDGSSNYISFTCADIFADSPFINKIIYKQNGQITGIFYPKVQ